MRFICLFLLMFIVNDFTHTDETSFAVSIAECQSVEIDHSQDLSETNGSIEEHNHGDCHCHHGHSHLVTLDQVKSSLEIKFVPLNNSFILFNSKPPKNILSEVNRPPIS